MSLEGNVDNGATTEQVVDTQEQVEVFHGALEEFQGLEATKETEEVAKSEEQKEPEKKTEQKEEKAPENQEVNSRAINGLLATLKAEREKRRAATQEQRQTEENDPFFTDPAVIADEVFERIEQKQINESIERAILKDPAGAHAALEAISINPYLQERISRSRDKGEEVLNISRVRASINEAGSKYGEEYAAAFDFVGARKDLCEQVFSSKNPGETVLRLYKKETLFSGYDSAEDEEAYILKLADEIKARKTPTQPTTLEQPKQAVELPKPSLARATGTAPTKQIPPENVADYTFKD